MSWLTDILGTSTQEAPQVKTQQFQDPTLQQVSNPLAAYLASETGKGLPTYTGEVAPNLPDNYTSRYNDYLSLDPNSYFDKYVQAPQTQAFKEDFLPTINEGFAGNLRGSGRFSTEDQAINKFQQGLATQRADFVDKTAKGQIDAGHTYYSDLDLMDQQKLKQWAQSLPENNPVLDKALEFLGKDTGNGFVNYLNPGSQGWIGQALGAFTGSNSGQGIIGNAVKGIGSFLGGLF